MPFVIPEVKETIPSDHKAREASHGHVSGTLPEEATL